MPESKVRDIVNFQFTFAKQWMHKPQKPALYLSEWGRYEIRSSSIKKELRILIKQLREDPTNEIYLDLFRFWWAKRHMAEDYYKSKKRPTIKKLIDERFKNTEPPSGGQSDQQS